MLFSYKDGMIKLIIFAVNLVFALKKLSLSLCGIIIRFPIGSIRSSKKDGSMELLEIDVELFILINYNPMKMY